MIHKTLEACLLMAASTLALAIAAPAHADPQRAQAQANFVAADTNQDQLLNMAEFITFINLNADHGLGRAVTVRRFGMHAKAFATADANGDGVVSKEEIAARAQQ
ncbi:MAG: hypothetical protein NW217_00620 [Hyphomicrobiaceae bacterium]|nr:hypothetical protein [Hyphomicrobiaceae bacterium]